MSVKIIQGDALAALKALADESVDCCVSSPPYWGLRDYGNGSAGIGLERTMSEHIAALVAVFDEVFRVLKPEGTFWLNYGDAYATRPTGTDKGWDKSGLRPGSVDGVREAQKASRTDGRDFEGIKHKNLLGLPWRIAFALQDRGWYLRSDIIWSKPNTMPEPVTDRPTRSHEFVFLMTKSPRYYYDAAAIAEPAKYVGIAGQDASGFKNAAQYDGKHADATKQDQHGRRFKGFNGRWAAKGTKRLRGPGMKPSPAIDAGAGNATRNRRTVWTIAPAQFAEAHFAVMPTALASLCIRAGCPVGGTVLDPFGGAGTTGLAADRLQRNAILIELNRKNIALIEHRLKSDEVGPLFPAPLDGGEQTETTADFFPVAAE